MRLALDTARIALRRAMELRKRLGIPMDHAISVVDVAEQVGVEVWFKPLPSLAGMYSKPPNPIIVLGSDRPIGYQTATCGHELGHHVFEHGTRVDEYTDGRMRPSDDPEEALVDMFAAHLAMPQAAVRRVFQCRGWDLAAPTAEQVFIAASHLGVGYGALVHHLRWTLGVIAPSLFDTLIQIGPAELRGCLLGRPLKEGLIIVDSFWTDRAVDLLVGDVATLPAGCSVEGRALEVLARESTRVIVRAIRRGLARADRGLDDWSAFIRVMPRQFSGAAVHRHLEDPDE